MDRGGTGVTKNFLSNSPLLQNTKEKVKIDHDYP